MFRDCGNGLMTASISMSVSLYLLSLFVLVKPRISIVVVVGLTVSAFDTLLRVSFVHHGFRKCSRAFGP